MKSRFDVLGLGCTAIDEILYVSNYPPADAKVQVRARERHCGGLCATALVAAARLGAQSAFAGILGTDEDSQFVLAAMRHEGIETESVLLQSGCGPIRSMIVVDQSKSTRTIFYDDSRAAGASRVHPRPEMIRRARVLLVDRFGIRGMIRAARIARRARVAVVADFESHRVPHFGELLRLSDHLIVSERFACAFTHTRTAAAAVQKLWRADRQVVIVTAGARGCWFLEAGGSGVREWPSERVRAVDTTGCGDVFHGAYAAALARGLPLETRLTVASAAAAIKATRHGGQAGIPTWKEVTRRIERRK